jgi:hypothetical protein
MLELVTVNQSIDTPTRGSRLAPRTPLRRMIQLI